MRIARGIAALVALGTVAFAVGDFASHPNAVGAIGLLLLIAVFAFLLSYLFRPEGGRQKRERPARPEPERPSRARKPKPAEPVWSGWDASEADAARQRRRERPRD